MMDGEPKDGGPTFPLPELFDKYGNYGLSIRDYFAGKALQAFITADGAQYFQSHEAHAQEAYAQADAMLKARKETP